MKSSRRLMYIFVAVFLIAVILKLILSFAYFPITDGDDKTWYFMGEYTLRLYGLEDQPTGDMIGFYDEHYQNYMENMTSVIAYLPILWYGMAFLVKVSGSNYYVFDMAFILLLNLADILIFLLLYRILRIGKVSERTAFILSLVYFLNPVNLDNLKWRQMNTLSVLFLSASVYLFMIKEEARSAISFSIAYITKLLTVILFPVFLIKYRARARMLFLMVIIPLIGSAVYILASSFDLIENLVFGVGSGIGDPWHLSFSALFTLFGLGSPAVSAFFTGLMVVLMLASYFVFRKESLSSMIFVVMSLYFLLANLIEIHHIIFLYAALIMNWERSGLIRKISPLYFIVPLGWFFSTDFTIGTRLLYSFVEVSLPYISIKIITISLFKIVVFIGLLPYILSVRPGVVYSDLCRGLGRIRSVLSH
jgi:hypothetical protein